MSHIKNKKKLRFISITIVVLFAIGYLLYFYPIQKYLAEKSFEKYISVQEISKYNIKDKRILKDYTQDGYYIDVVYKDDDDYIYSYKYFVGKNPFKYNISCEVYNKQNTSVGITGQKIKYPPLRK